MGSSHMTLFVLRIVRRHSFMEVYWFSARKNCCEYTSALPILGSGRSCWPQDAAYHDRINGKLTNIFSALTAQLDPRRTDRVFRKIYDVVI